MAMIERNPPTIYGIETALELQMGSIAVREE